MENKSTETTKPTVETKQEESLETLISKAKVHILNVKEQVLKYTGKVGYNPYVWLKDKGFTKAELMITNPEVFSNIDLKIHLTSILSIKAEPPTIIPPPILDRQELNEKFLKEREIRKGKDKK